MSGDINVFTSGITSQLTTKFRTVTQKFSDELTAKFRAKTVKLKKSFQGKFSVIESVPRLRFVIVKIYWYEQIN